MDDNTSLLLEKLREQMKDFGGVLTFKQWVDLRDEQEQPNKPKMVQVVDTAIHLIQELYVHLDLKRVRRGVDPVAQLTSFRVSIEDGRVKAPRVFHKTMFEIFKSLGDVHTAYRPPFPYRNAVAFLPFLLRDFHEDGRQRYLISHSLFDGDDAFQHIPLGRGTEVISWNGVPMADAVMRAAEFEEGSNVPHDLALGLQFMTVRWLGSSIDPDSPWVIIGYRDEHGKDREFRCFWLVLHATKDPKFLVASQAAETVFRVPGPRGGEERALHIGSDIVHGVRLALWRSERHEKLSEPAPAEPRRALMALFYGYVGREELAAFTEKYAPIRSGDDGDEVPSLLPEFLEAWIHKGTRLVEKAGTGSSEDSKVARKRFGYIRIRAFPMENPDRDFFSYEVRRLLNLMPPDGLIVDIRDNPGGSTTNAERLLQFLTANDITPLPFHFIATPLTKRLATEDLSGYEASIEAGLRTGARFSAGQPITSLEEANELGQHYFGPVLLITNAASYSAADIFAAGFQDNKGGDILGLDETTGAGGANCWFFDPELRPLVDADELLPSGFNMQFAVRQCLRVGKDTVGLPIEEIGIKPDTSPYQLRRDDLLDPQPWGLLLHAAKILAMKPSYDLTTSLVQNGEERRLEVRTTGIKRLAFLINGRPSSADVDVHDETVKSPRLPAGKRIELEIHGFAEMGDDMRMKRVARFIRVFPP